MVLHIRHVLKHSEGIPSLRGGSMELCSGAGLLGVHPKVSQCPTSIRNGKTYEYIIKHGQHPIGMRSFEGKDQKQNHEGLGLKWIIPMWMGNESMRFHNKWY